MIIPVRCWSCGKPIAHLWDQYKERTEKGETEFNKNEGVEQLFLGKFAQTAADAHGKQHKRHDHGPLENCVAHKIGGQSGQDEFGYNACAAGGK